MPTPPEMRYERERLNTVDPQYASSMPGTQGDRNRKYVQERLAKYPGIQATDFDVSKESGDLYQSYTRRNKARDDAEAEYQTAHQEEQERMLRQYTPESRKRYKSRDDLDSRAHLRLGMQSSDVYEKNVLHVQERNLHHLGPESDRKTIGPGLKDETLAPHQRGKRNMHHRNVEREIEKGKTEFERTEGHRRMIREESPSLIGLRKDPERERPSRSPAPHAERPQDMLVTPEPTRPSRRDREDSYEPESDHSHRRPLLSSLPGRSGRERDPAMGTDTYRPDYRQRSASRSRHPDRGMEYQRDIPHRVDPQRRHRRPSLIGRSDREPEFRRETDSYHPDYSQRSPSRPRRSDREREHRSERPYDVPRRSIEEPRRSRSPERSSTRHRSPSRYRSSRHEREQSRDRYADRPTTPPARSRSRAPPSSYTSSAQPHSTSHSSRPRSSSQSRSTLPSLLPKRSSSRRGRR